MGMLYRIWLLVIAVVMVAITIDAGWLQESRRRAGGVLCLLAAAAMTLYAVRPNRPRGR